MLQLRYEIRVLIEEPKITKGCLGNYSLEYSIDEDSS